MRIVTSLLGMLTCMVTVTGPPSVEWLARDMASLGSGAAHLRCDLRQQHTPHALDGRLNLFN